MVSNLFSLFLEIQLNNIKEFNIDPQLYQFYLNLGLKAQKLSVLLFKLTQNSHPGKYFTSYYLGLRSKLGFISDCRTLPCTIEIKSDKDHIEHSIYSVEMLENSKETNEIAGKDQRHNHVTLMFKNKELIGSQQQENLPIQLQDHFWDNKTPKIVNYSVLVDVFTFKNKKELTSIIKEFEKQQNIQHYPLLPLKDQIRIDIITKSYARFFYTKTNQYDRIMRTGSYSEDKNMIDITNNGIKNKKKVNKQKSLVDIRKAVLPVRKEKQTHKLKRSLIKNKSSTKIINFSNKNKNLAIKKNAPVTVNVKKQNLVLPIVNESRKSGGDPEINKEDAQAKEDDKVKENVSSLPLIQQYKIIKKKSRNKNSLV